MKCSLLDGGANEIVDCFTSNNPVDKIGVHGNGDFDMKLNKKIKSNYFTKMEIIKRREEKE